MRQHPEDSELVRRALQNTEITEWTGLLESNGVRTVGDLKRVKYSDLSKYGVTEFEPRRKIFEYIKRLNVGDAGKCKRKDSFSLHTPLRPSLRVAEDLDASGLSIAKELEAMAREEAARARREKEEIKRDESSVHSATFFNSSFLGSGARGRASIPREWKTRREMVSEIMEEAENSIIEESGAPDEEDTAAEQSSLVSDSFPDESSLAGEAPEAKKCGRIFVVVRKRPMRGSARDVVAVQGSVVVLTERKQKIDLTPYVEPHTFRFDRAFDETQGTEALYSECVKDLVAHALSGGGSTCLAYGQTGSGKTYTMLNESAGVIALALRDLLAAPVRISFYEIYANNIYDLLDDRKRIFAREKDGVVSIMGVSEKSVTQMDEARAFLRLGLSSRMTGRTGANTSSSRSHAIFRARTASGVLTFVDLAGSERGSERSMEGSTAPSIKREGAEINKSLLALKECIRAMDRSASHLPFRHSKLTQVLKESLVGNSKCCIIATVSPEEPSTEHTLNTLRYAFRVKEIDRHRFPSLSSSASPSDSSPARKPSAPGRTRDLSPRSPAVVDKSKIHQALAVLGTRIARETDPKVLEAVHGQLVEIIAKTGLVGKK